ncbi:hypothetical protein ACTD5D_19320 [Nocardia takedensis]|uniref:hypothetical protein n=1 Tax=Nocardia takedensis TaxID=259390 RepID=UPI003F777017
MVGAAVLISLWASGMSAILALWFWPVITPVTVGLASAWWAWVFVRYRLTRSGFESGRAAAYLRYQAAHTEWAARVNEYERNEHRRVTTTPLWHPVALPHRSVRVDVFGGTADGWASLLATTGLSLLSTGEPILVLDLSEQQVTDGLAALAHRCGHPVRCANLPAAGPDLLTGLDPAQVGEILAAAIEGFRAEESRASLRALDAELVEMVASSLAAPITFTRLAAGIRVMRRTLEVDHDTALSPSEIRQITAHLDVVGSDTARQELQFLGGLLTLLASEQPAPDAAAFGWPRAGLRVLSTGDANPRRKDLLDRLLLQRLLHDLRARSEAVTAVLIVAGADHLGAADLETLTRHARRRGVRTMLMFEHARDQTAGLLGGADSATVLMRLGNADEAAAAAGFVGRGHRFTLSQMTRQIGSSFTGGGSDSTGDSLTTSTSDGLSGNSANSSTSTSRARTWSSTTNWTEGHSTSTATTHTRGYEYTIEPTTFQSLPPTAFILVENHSAGRTVVTADCNPGIVLLDRVAPDHHTTRTSR